MNKKVLTILAIALGLAIFAMAKGPDRLDPFPPPGKQINPKQPNYRAYWPSSGQVNGPAVSMHAALSNAYIETYRTHDDLYLNVELEGRDTYYAPEMPLNIAIVIDRSGSMNSSDKLPYAKQAAKEFVSRLNPSDRVSIIAYNESVITLLHSTKASNRHKINSAIDSLHADGYTNLSGGVLEGIREVKRHLRRNGVNRVILISDGLANRGIVYVPDLISAINRASDEMISVSTIGVGVDFNEDLLDKVASRTGGNYYYADEAFRFADIFNDEFTRLSSIIAKNPKLTIKLQKGVELVELFGYDYFYKGRTVSVKLPSIHSGEERKVILRLRVSSSKSGARKIAKVKLNYRDLVDDKNQTLALNLGAVATRDEARLEEGFNKRVMKDAEKARTGKIMDKAIRLFQKGERDKAQRLIEKQIKRAKKANMKLKSPELEAAIDDLSTSGAEMKAPKAPAEKRDMEIKTKIKAKEMQQ